ncbi:hypothetical protein CCAX7_58110 [Capsulimonas corticalis]|uniref:Uncharacterized protein n=1 Tax=Capsulimonas corticalis TaxID=2219043 RepID=A0A402D070_9BACT|nr:hypothetical protein [Capsulimonas corticalis]BDI33760.1 hypothetical protein CCAX7_58110 [Capsulimonas corticalis]
MTITLIHRLSRFLPAVLAAAATAAQAPAPVAPPAKPAPIHLAAPAITATPAASNCPPQYVGQWMDANHIPHTAPFFPEPISAEPRCK